MDTVAQLRIGELARRTGVAPATLRVWQRRYGVPSPTRTSSGYRLYSEADVEIVMRMRRLVDEGMSTAEAASVVEGAPERQQAVGRLAAPELDADRIGLKRELANLDGASAHMRIDSLLMRLSVSAVLSGVILPVLAELGDEVVTGEARIAQEHFATSLLRARVGALTRGWEHGDGRAAVLAAVDGDQHDFGLMVFGLALRERGWRIIWLGASTPVEEIAWAADKVDAGIVVASMTGGRVVEQDLMGWKALAKRRAVAFGGVGASHELADAIGAVCLGGDAVAAARHDCFARP